MTKNTKGIAKEICRHLIETAGDNLYCKSCNEETNPCGFAVDLATIAENYIQNENAMVLSDYLQSDKKTYTQSEVDNLLINLGIIDEINRKCDCYRTAKERHYYTDYEKGLFFGMFGRHLDKDYEYVTYSYCAGTRECDRCSCNGDERKCDFYPHKRGEK